MNCSQCSNPLAPNAKFCKNCGARQDTPAAETTPLEKTCAHCLAVCKPQAKFCPKCGSVFDAGAAATAAVPSAPSASIARTDPPLIEPMDEPMDFPAAPTASPVAVNAPVNAPVFPARNDNPPAFPQEPVRSSKAWIKWAVLALIVAAIGGGMLMANNMKALSGANSTPTASQAGKDSVSPEDKAKADALVGPQVGNAAPAAPLNDPSSVTIAPPPEQISPPPVVNTAPAAPVINTGPELAPPPSAPSAAPSKPAPVKVQPAKKSGGPSLDDLLD